MDETCFQVAVYKNMKLRDFDVFVKKIKTFDKEEEHDFSEKVLPQGM